MDLFILVRANNRLITVRARSNGTITQETLRSAFFLERDVPICLVRNNIVLACHREGDSGLIELESDFHEAEFTLLWEEAQRSRPVTSIKQDYKIEIRSWSDENVRIPARVVRVIKEIDTIILESEGEDFCDKDLVSSSIFPRKGLPYTMMGFSSLHDVTSHQLLSTGIIVSYVSRRLRYTGSSSSFKRHTGGSCWTKNGQLIGIQIEAQKVPQDEERLPTSPAPGGHCFIVAIDDMVGYIKDLLPKKDSDGEWKYT